MSGLTLRTLMIYAAKLFFAGVVRFSDGLRASSARRIISAKFNQRGERAMLYRTKQVVIKTSLMLMRSHKTREWLKKYHAFVFYGAALTALLSGAAATSDHAPTAVAALFVVGLFTWTLLEYSVHRFAFHSDAKRRLVPEVLSAYHLKHHRDPKAIDELFMGLSMSVPVAAAYYALAWATAGSWQAASYLYLGLMSGYFAYEYVHYSVHHRTCRSRWLKYMKRYHLGRHHRASDVCYGLTSPLVDLLFGTYEPLRQGDARSKGRRRLALKTVLRVSQVLALMVFSAAPSQAQVSARTVREIVYKLGAGPDARVTVSLKDKTTVKGYVSRIGEDHIVVIPQAEKKNGSPMIIAYRDIARIKRKGKVAPRL